MKKTVFVLSGVLCIAAVTAVSCGNGSVDGGLPLESSIVCFGDSLTEGFGAVTPGVVDKTKSYPAYLANSVKIPVVNAGVSGDTSAQGLSRLSRDVLSKNPQIVIIEFGANDLFTGVLPPATQNYLGSMLSTLNNGSRKIYLAKFYTEAVARSLLAANGVTDTTMQTMVITQYNTMFTTLAQSYNVTLIEDIWTGVWGVTGKMSDIVHPNAQGYQKMADNILNVMRPYLQSNGFLK